MNQAQPLPMTTAELRERGWDRPDITLVTGDAYVDHPSFGIALIGRHLESLGYRVAVIAQPDWRSRDDFAALPAPALFFGVSAGNVDSMVANYSPAKKRRRVDSFSPGGAPGVRPDRATIVYCNRLRESYPDTPIVLGGVEASLRRFAHYDYWDDSVRRSIVVDSRADVLVYGMGERASKEIAARLEREGAGRDTDLSGIPGTCVVSKENAGGEAAVEIPSFEAVSADPEAFARAFDLIRREMCQPVPRMIVQRHQDRYVIQYPPAEALSVSEMDSLYALPFTRAAHPSYDRAGGVPAIEEVLFSITSHRGCLGACSFCALWAHQGGVIQRRSIDSLVAEATRLAHDPRFKGFIHDVGGPTANFYAAGCARGKRCGARDCLYPSPCRNLLSDHTELVRALRAVRAVPGVKRVFVRSGVRFDYAMLDESGLFLPELVRHHVSGQLKVAPEHISDPVLSLMRKPGHDVYEAFTKEYSRLNREAGKDQYLVPYLISGHPGSTMKHAVELADYIHSLGYTPEQVQDFTPTPMTEATCMYYTGIDPRTGNKVHVPKGREKILQRALLQPDRPENRELVKEAYESAGRVPPPPGGAVRGARVDRRSRGRRGRGSESGKTAQPAVAGRARRGRARREDSSGPSRRPR